MTAADGARGSHGVRGSLLRQQAPAPGHAGEATAHPDGLSGLIQRSELLRPGPLLPPPLLALALGGVGGAPGLRGGAAAAATAAAAAAALLALPLIVAATEVVHPPERRRSKQGRALLHPTFRGFTMSVLLSFPVAGEFTSKGSAHVSTDGYCKDLDVLRQLLVGIAAACLGRIQDLGLSVLARRRRGRFILALLDRGHHLQGGLHRPRGAAVGQAARRHAALPNGRHGRRSLLARREVSQAAVVEDEP
mmetsp:Transcript_129146/g.413933  ORF Transcript_129146/g.413933 Transcript_129146/m.413933 type:complete len:249 (-) Transcript_129146:139-885(-)